MTLSKMCNLRRGFVLQKKSWVQQILQTTIVASLGLDQCRLECACYNAFFTYPDMPTQINYFVNKLF
uniref:Uncharacterized protein n=1 Tax=Anguilla anguilla TaxID=7936 RepID=A0A0E9RTY1_ANGAN